MRSLATLALLLTAATAQAETGPPTAAEIAQAKADCAAEVTQDCLFVLALEAALSTPDLAEFLLNDIAFAQATAGDTSGAERTLTFTTPGFLALMALGRDEEAAIAFKAFAEEIGGTVGTAEPLEPGEKELATVGQLVGAGRIDEALKTAQSIPEEGRSKQKEALRLIVDYHLERQDLEAAEAVAFLIPPFDPSSPEYYFRLDGAYFDPRADALVAVVKARATAGDLKGAARLTNSLIDPRTSIMARLVLAEAYFKAELRDEAITQLDLILVGLPTMEQSPHFGLEELTQSADLALRFGESKIARRHADLAYKTYSKSTVRRAGRTDAERPSRDALLHLATVLQLLGQTGKSSTLFAKAQSRGDDDPWLLVFPHGDTLDLSAALLVSQIRLDDPKAQETIRRLLDDPTRIGRTGLDILYTAALDLAELGLLEDALAIADQVEPLLRDDSFRMTADDPAKLYSAILAQDPGLAPRILTDSIEPVLKQKVSLSLARTLAQVGQTEKARSLLNGLVEEQMARTKPEESIVCSYRSIALMQEKLAFHDDAAKSRALGLAYAAREASTEAQVADFLILAASFGDAKAGSLSLGLGCLKYF